MGLVVFSFLALAVFWVVMFKSQVSGGLNFSETSGETEFLGQSKNLLSPAAALIDGFKNLKDDVVKKVSEYKANGAPAAGENARPVYELPWALRSTNGYEYTNKIPIRFVNS